MIPQQKMSWFNSYLIEKDKSNTSFNWLTTQKFKCGHIAAEIYDIWSINNVCRSISEDNTLLSLNFLTSDIWSCNNVCRSISRTLDKYKKPSFPFDTDIINFSKKNKKILKDHNKRKWFVFTSMTKFLHLITIIFLPWKIMSLWRLNILGSNVVTIKLFVNGSSSIPLIEAYLSLCQS